MCQQDTSVFIAEQMIVLFLYRTPDGQIHLGDGEWMLVSIHSMQIIFRKKINMGIQERMMEDMQDYTTLLEGLTESTYGFSAGFPLVLIPLNRILSTSGFPMCGKHRPLEIQCTRFCIQQFRCRIFFWWLEIRIPQLCSLVLTVHMIRALTWLPMNKPVCGGSGWIQQSLVSTISNQQNQNLFFCWYGKYLDSVNTIDVPLTTNNLKN